MDCCPAAGWPTTKSIEQKWHIQEHEQWSNQASINSILVVRISGCHQIEYDNDDQGRIDDDILDEARIQAIEIEWSRQHRETGSIGC